MVLVDPVEACQDGGQGGTLHNALLALGRTPSHSGAVRSGVGGGVGSGVSDGRGGGGPEQLGYAHVVQGPGVVCSEQVP